MTIINIEDLKKAVLELNGINPFSEEMTFYYDESGNCRKFFLTEAGFNCNDSLKGNFVLAGVAHEEEACDIDILALQKSLNYSDRQKELKFKHLYYNSKERVNI